MFGVLMVRFIHPYNCLYYTSQLTIPLEFLPPLGSHRGLISITLRLFTAFATAFGG